MEYTLWPLGMYGAMIYYHTLVYNLYSGMRVTDGRTIIIYIYIIRERERERERERLQTLNSSMWGLLRLAPVIPLALITECFAPN